MISTGKEALHELVSGNRRYVAGNIVHKKRTHERREEVARRQYPIAVVVGCADSRVPLEIIFDQGFGDLFVVRTAGNVIDNAGFGSVEFAVHFLKVNLVLVLGHKRCSAVQAAIHGVEAPGHIASIIKAIAPCVRKTKDVSDKAWDAAVRANIRMEVKRLKSAQPILKKKALSGELLIIGGFYDLDSGKVLILK